MLAGERWSDHPQCTHPAVASLARLVNDCIDDGRRWELAPLIPSVVGLSGRGALTSVLVAIHAAGAALPVVSEARQRALAAGLLRAIELVTGHDHHATADQQTCHIVRHGRAALESAPGAAAWAQQFLRDNGRLPLKSLDRMCEAMLRTAVVGIAEACVPDPDRLLQQLLASTVAELSVAATDAPAEAAVVLQQA